MDRRSNMQEDKQQAFKIKEKIWSRMHQLAFLRQHDQINKATWCLLWQNASASQFWRSNAAMFASRSTILRQLSKTRIFSSINLRTQLFLTLYHRKTQWTAHRCKDSKETTAKKALCSAKAWSLPPQATLRTSLLLGRNLRNPHEKATIAHLQTVARTRSRHSLQSCRKATNSSKKSSTRSTLNQRFGLCMRSSNSIRILIRNERLLRKKRIKQKLRETNFGQTFRKQLNASRRIKIRMWNINPSWLMKINRWANKSCKLLKCFLRKFKKTMKSHLNWKLYSLKTKIYPSKSIISPIMRLNTSVRCSDVKN